jgi:trimethylamine:corrinoid methyltransferase-like protein
VLVPQAVVDDAVAACPASYSLAARDRERSLVLDAEPGVTYVHNMGGARDVIDPRTGAGGVRGWPTRSAPAA